MVLFVTTAQCARPQRGAIHAQSGGFGEAFEHHADGGDADAGFAAGHGLFVVLAEAAIGAQPGEGAFDNPALLQQHEALGAWGPALHLQGEVALLQLGEELLVIVAAVPARPLQPRELRRGHALEQPAGATPVGDVGGGDDHGHEQAERVHGDVAFAALDLLAAVVTPLLAPDFGGLGRLAVQDHEAGRLLAGPRRRGRRGRRVLGGRGRRGLCGIAGAGRPLLGLGAGARGGNAEAAAQGVEDGLPDAALLPGLVVVERRALGRQVVGQHVPLAARVRLVQDRVDHLAQVRRRLPRFGHRRRHQLTQYLPLRVRQVRLVPRTPLATGLLFRHDSLPSYPPPSEQLSPVFRLRIASESGSGAGSRRAAARRLRGRTGAAPRPAWPATACRRARRTRLRTGSGHRRTPA